MSLFSAQIIDLHTYTVTEALQIFVQIYNQHVKSGEKSPLEVVHGYGSSGLGGNIRQRIRTYLQNHIDKLSFCPGEQVDGNPGYTLVYPKLLLPNNQDTLREGILLYCTAARSEDKIAGRFRRYGDVHVRTALRELEKDGSLTISWKGKHKCYCAR